MVQHLNPPALPHNPAFSQGVAVSSGARTVYVGGQNGTGDTLLEQSRSALRNVETVVTAAGGTLSDVVMWWVAIRDGSDVRQGLQAFTEVWQGHGPAPAISVLGVASLARPAFLVEISAVAVVDR